MIIETNSQSKGGGTVDTAMSDSSTNAVQNKVIKTYVDTEDAALQAAINSKQNVANKITLTDNSTVALADNTEYSGTDLTTLTFTYPQGDFECYMLLSFASSGTITVTFPTSSYIGDAPTFANGDTWEISIKNGIIVAGQVTNGA